MKMRKAAVLDLLLFYVSLEVTFVVQVASAAAKTEVQKPKGEVRQFLDTYCALLPKLGGASSGDLAAAIGSEFQALFHPTLDSCGWDAINPIMGYQLKKATYQECLDAEATALSKGRLLKAGTVKCTEKIADEEQGSAAFVTEAVWTPVSVSKDGKSTTVTGESFTANFAERLKLTRSNIDGKLRIASYHLDFDSYNFLPTTYFHDMTSSHDTSSSGVDTSSSGAAGAGESSARAGESKSIFLAENQLGEIQKQLAERKSIFLAAQLPSSAGAGQHNEKQLAAHQFGFPSLAKPTSIVVGAVGVAGALLFVGIFVGAVAANLFFKVKKQNVLLGEEQF